MIQSDLLEWKQYGINKNLIISYFLFFIIIGVILLMFIATLFSLINNIIILNIIAFIISISLLLIMIYVLKGEIKRFKMFNKGSATTIYNKNRYDRHRIINLIKNNIPCERINFSIPIAEKLGGQSFFRIASDDNIVIQIYPSSSNSFSIILSPLASKYKRNIEKIIDSYN